MSIIKTYHLKKITQLHRNICCIKSFLFTFASDYSEESFFFSSSPEELDEHPLFIAFKSLTPKDIP